MICHTMSDAYQGFENFQVKLAQDIYLAKVILSHQMDQNKKCDN